MNYKNFNYCLTKLALQPLSFSLFVRRLALTRVFSPGAIVSQSAWIVGLCALGTISTGCGSVDPPPPPPPPPPPLSGLELFAGDDHACALLEGGDLRCWGVGERQALGYGSTEDVLTGERRLKVAREDGYGVTQVALGGDHTCALLQNPATRDSRVRCWGNNNDGQLGIGRATPNELSAGDAAEVQLLSPQERETGVGVIQIVASRHHNCTLLERQDANTAVRCWGAGANARLGYGNIDDITGDIPVYEAGNVEVVDGADVDSDGSSIKVIQLTAGFDHTCALLDNGAVRCWGDNYQGQLGYEKTRVKQWVGGQDGRSPASVGDVTLGEPVKQIDAGTHYTCALLERGAVRCWGNNDFGQIADSSVHKDVTILTPEELKQGLQVTQVSAGGWHACSLLSDGGVRCWGAGAADVGNTSLTVLDRRHGYERSVDNAHVGDQEGETPAELGNVPNLGKVKSIAATGSYTCAVMEEDNSVSCWGSNTHGKLGNGEAVDRGLLGPGVSTVLF